MLFIITDIGLKLSAEDSDNLRLINGYYPNGEPQAGQWIKIFKY